jgi:hypothetical protein
MTSEAQKFDAGIRKILSVSREELKRREEQWQKNREGKTKPGPKPKVSPASRVSKTKV